MIWCFFNLFLCKEFNVVMKNIYIVDFLNIFSDFREMKYNLYNMDWRDFMYSKFETDLNIFFKWFFNYYVKELKLHDDYEYIFIMKNVGFTNLFKTLIKEYPNISFMYMEKHAEPIIEKNKDDFLCNYFYAFYKIQGHNIQLISNDKYKDLENYYQIFRDKTFDIKIIKNSQKYSIKLHIHSIIIEKMLKKIEKNAINKKNLKYLDYYN